MTNLYKEGVAQALRAVGIKVAEDLDAEGTPYPDKHLVINAEALAQRLRQDADDDEGVGENIRAENASYAWDRPVTWSAPTNLSGLNSGQGTPGMMTPGNQRG